jgi:aminopeptidase N
MKSTFMKISIWLTLIIGTVKFAIGQKPGSIMDVKHYTFSVELNDNNDSIKCNATIRVKLLNYTDSIVLDLISRKTTGKGMEITSIWENKKTLNFVHLNDRVHIRFPVKGNINEEKIIQLEYYGIPADGLVISKNKYNHRTFFSDHWPNRARHWLPCVDHPSDKASVEFFVIAPLHYQVVSNGMLIEETNLDAFRRLTHYREQIEIPMKIAAIGVADFAVRFEGNVNNIPVYSWVFPEDREQGFYDYKLATAILPFFIRNVGTYGYEKLANVQSKTIFGGMENASAIFYGENTITGKRTAEELIAHEIAHQWFGDMVTESDWPHLWLSEGFATYMAIMYMEYKYGSDTAMKMRHADRSQVTDFLKHHSRPVVDTSAMDYLELLNVNSYQKGGWILHMLRRELGDSIFWNGIRFYYEQFAGKNAVTDDLRKSFEKVSGKDLKHFFLQWLYSVGHPILNIEWKYDTIKKLVNISMVQLQETLFVFPMEIKLTSLTKDSNTTKTLLIREKRSSIQIPVTSKPVGLLIDPGVNLLYEGKVTQLE